VTHGTDGGGVTTPAAPQSAPTTTAPANGPADGGQQAPATSPAPVPAPPANQPAQPQGNRDMAAQPTAPATDAPKFTQADLDRILDDRMTRFEKSFNTKMAQALGITDPAAEVDPVKALEAEKKTTATERTRADLADARSLATLAGVSKEHVETFLKLVDLGPLKTLDRTDPAAVTAAIQKQVDAALTAAPMFKGSALPAASGGDRQGVGQPSLDEQIAAAQKSGDHATAIALKRQKLYQTGG